MKEAGILVGNLKETNLGVAQHFLTTNSDHFKLRPKSEIYIPKRDDEPLWYGSPPPPQAFDRYSHDSWTYGLNRRDELLLSIFFLFYSFLVFCVVRNFRLSLLNNFYCKILHLYNIVIPRKFSNICKPREEGWYGQPKYCYGRTIHFVLNQLCSSLWTSRFWFLTLRLIRSLF